MLRTVKTVSVAPASTQDCEERLNKAFEEIHAEGGQVVKTEYLNHNPHSSWVPVIIEYDV